ncbi:MAG: hypothetical protein Q7T56_10625 [Nocardioidaceae bacterium]|nr:hypothetical protein [Nocardioidaceae bacterium]
MAIALELPHDLLTTQQGVVTTSQALALFGQPRLRSELDGRRWRSPARGVVVTHNGPLTEQQRTWVALLASARGSVVGGITALRQDGFTGFATRVEVPRVVQPMGARRPSFGDVQVHWSIALDQRDVHPVREPARTRPARSAVDEASWSRDPRRARAIVLAAVQQRLVEPRAVREAVGRRGACRHRGLILESGLDAGGGIQSLPELDFDDLRTGAGIPAPSRQTPVKGADGRFHLDVEWRELGTACEIHGMPHLEVEQWDSDLLRANEITIAGPRLLLFSSYAVRHQQQVVVSQLVRMLRRGGWSG